MPHNTIEGLRCRVRFPVFGRECNETVELTVPGRLFGHASPPARALLRRIFKVALLEREWVASQQHGRRNSARKSARGHLVALPLLAQPFAVAEKPVDRALDAGLVLGYDWRDVAMAASARNLHSRTNLPLVGLGRFT